jgi:AraC-like DNA-binding protein
VLWPRHRRRLRGASRRGKWARAIRGETLLKPPDQSATPAHWPAATREPATRLLGALTDVPGLVRQLGADPAIVLADAGIDAGALDDASERIPYTDLARLLAAAAARTGCPHFGLLAGGAWRLAHLGATGELIRNARTVGEGMEEFVVHQHLNSSGGVVFLVRRDGHADLGYATHSPVAASTSPIYDAMLAAALNCIREIGGAQWCPSEVLLAHSAPADAAPYRRCFGPRVRFDAGMNALRFPAAFLEQPIADANPGRLRQARAQVLAAGRATIVQDTARALRTLLLDGKSSGNDVAQALAIHRRTLNRRLSAEGTTFQKVLDTVRFTVAKEMLEDSRVAIPEIAVSLGYSDYVSFTRAFKRWTGDTPGAWRKRSPR